MGDTIITMIRAIKCKMVPTLVMAKALEETAGAFADACNYAVSFGLTNKIKLQKAAYYDIRKRFGLSANLTIQAIRRVASALVAAKRKKVPVGGFAPTSISYDARVFAFRPKDESVSLTVLNGRIHVPLDLGEYQRSALIGKTPTAATVCKKGRGWNIHIVVEDPDADPVDGPPMGVDLGVRNTAATSNGTLHDGLRRRAFKENRMRIRASLQSKGTRGAKRVLSRLSGYEARRIRHENHEVSRSIVSEAQRHQCGIIRLEQLTGIRSRTKIWNKHSNRMVAGWSFGQLQGFIEYKSTHLGIQVEYVNPRNTSKSCSGCGNMGIRKQDRFFCLTCGEKHADLNASLNISRGGVVLAQPESTPNIIGSGNPPALAVGNR